MLATIEANWQLAAGIAILALVLVLWLLTRARRPRERRATDDVLSEGAERARRNTALIDAPPAAAFTAAPADPIPMEVPLPVSEVEPTAEAALEADDLSRIKGLGPKLRARLAELGVTRFAQIAAWTDADLDALDPQLGAFAGRPRRDAWVEQAALLASGDVGAYEAKFGKV